MEGQRNRRDEDSVERRNGTGSRCHETRTSESYPLALVATKSWCSFWLLLLEKAGVNCLVCWQVLKVCANHPIQPDLKIDFKSPKEPKFLAWIGMDFSESTTGVVESFLCRFKTDDAAALFKVRFR